MTGLDMLLQGKRKADRMLFGGAVLMGFGVVVGLIHPKPAVYLTFLIPAVLLLSVGSLVYYWGIRCPRCSRRLGRIMVPVSWLGSADIDFKFCPFCGLDFARTLTADELESSKTTGAHDE